MPVATLRSLSAEQLEYQWFTEKDKQRHVASLRWADIRSVDVFKREVFSYDLICLDLASQEADSVELDEQDPQWDDLMTALPLRLPGCKTWDEWYADVVHPAFATNLQRIFERPIP